MSQTSKPSLSEIQARFAEILKSPSLNLEEVAPIFAASKNAAVTPLETRLAIYQYAYFARIEESLAADFPKLKAELGDEEFSEIISGYLDKYPSQYPSLAQVGKNLARYLAETHPYSEQPELIEQTKKEWAYCLCKWSENSRPADFSKLLELSEEEQLKQSLVLAPSAQIVKIETGFEVIFKVDHQLKTIELTPSMEKLLGEIQRGRNLGELTRFLEKNSELATGADAAALLAASAMTWISNWIAAGLIIDFTAK